MDAGVRWLHVHPLYLCDEECWAVVRLASSWREGVLPDAGGINDQPARTVAAIQTVLSAWSKMRAAADKRRRKDK
jgi:hypothetical protein